MAAIPPGGPMALDAAWFTATLRAAGVLRRGEVAAVEARQVGAGMLGDSIRFALTYDGDAGEAPASLVGKFASSDPVSRATGANFGLYMKEVRFYQEIAASVAIRTPRAYAAEIDPTTNDFILLLEDLTPARQGEQVAGCLLADAQMVIDQAAGLHGPRWGDPTLLTTPWLYTAPSGVSAHTLAFPEYLRQFRARYDDMLEPEYMRFLVAATDKVPAYHAIGLGQTPPTVQHLDFRLDNMLFEPRGGRDPLAVLDWQSVSAGPGVLDVSYFIGAGLPTAVRQAHERALLDRWIEGLRSHGVLDHDREQAWRDYRIQVMQGICTAIFASVATKRTPRGDDMFLTMARRHAQQAMDLETLSLLA